MTAAVNISQAHVTQRFRYFNDNDSYPDAMHLQKNILIFVTNFIGENCPIKFLNE